MSVSLYDQAVIDKIKSWLGPGTIPIMSSLDVEDTFSQVLDENNDQGIELPLIAVHRDGFTLAQTERATITSYGLTIEANPDNNEWVNAIRIGLEYQIDIYTRYMKEANEYVRNMVFNLINFPRVTIELPYYDQKLPFNSTIHIAEQIQDNSSIPQRMIFGQFTRLTIRAAINDAYLFDTRINKNARIDADIYLDDELIKETRFT